MREILLQTWLLNELTPEEAADLLRGATVAELPPGMKLTERGRKNDAICVVIDGEVRVDPSDHRLGPGEMLGEMSWLDGQPASATTVAAAATRILLIPHTVMNGFVGRNPEAHIQILKKLAINLSLRLRA